MLSEAIEMQYFDVASEFASTFLSTILKFDSLPCLDMFVASFGTNFMKYEARIHLMSILIPLIGRKQSESLC